MGKIWIFESKVRNVEDMPGGPWENVGTPENPIWQTDISFSVSAESQEKIEDLEAKILLLSRDLKRIKEVSELLSRRAVVGHSHRTQHVKDMLQQHPDIMAKLGWKKEDTG